MSSHSEITCHLPLSQKLVPTSEIWTTRLCALGLFLMNLCLQCVRHAGCVVLNGEFWQSPGFVPYGSRFARSESK